jgi:hypothetical protein
MIAIRNDRDRADRLAMTSLIAEAVSQFAKSERGMASAIARYPAGDGCR